MQWINTFFKTKVGIVVRNVIGLLLVVGGIIGLFLPFLQGIAMIAAGLLLLDKKELLEKTKNFFVVWGNKLKQLWKK